MKDKFYSYSKISTYEKCPRKFKFRYIDKLKVEFEVSIEGFLGNSVHESLEWLYKKVLENEIPTLKELLEFYKKIWEENFSTGIKINNQNLAEKDYFEKGILFLTKYYQKHAPFEDNTLELEKKIFVDLGDYKLIGFIDRLSFDEKNEEFIIHDYKTGKSKFYDEKQLALYSIAIQEKYNKKTCLVWHFLSHDEKICVRKTEDEMNKIRKELLTTIKKIEQDEKFLPNVSKLCDWCEFKKYCPAFRKEYPKYSKQSRLKF